MKPNTEINATMKTKIIISAVILSAAIWFAVNWFMRFMRFMEVKDYVFIAAMMIVVVWYVAKVIIEIINKEKQ